MKARKFTAIFTLSALIFSSCETLFADMREEKLDQREKILTERALVLSDQSVNLDDREQELNRRAAQLEELSKSIKNKNIDFTVREIEIDEIKASLNRDSELLASQRFELARDREQFALYKSEVEKRAENAVQVAQEAEQKLKAAEEREARTAKREREISAREEEIIASLSEIELTKAELLMLRAQSSDAAAKIAMLEKQKEDLEEAQKIFAGEKQKLESSLAKERTELQSITALRDKAVNDAQALRAQAEELSRRIEEVLSKNREQEATIEKLSADLVAKTEELHGLYSGTIPLPIGITASLVIGIPHNSSVIVTNTGLMNWSDGSIRALGMGVAPDGLNEAQGRLLARRAAMLDLQRNLLETIQGVQIDSKTKMSEYVIKYDIVESKVNGIISGVEIVKETWDPEKKIYEISGQIRQDKLAEPMTEIAKHINRKKLPKGNKPKTGDYTGLILDVRHLTVTQQKFFHVLDEKGNVVYGPECADPSKMAKDGLCVYYQKIVLTADEKARVGNNPLVIRAQRFSSNGEDIVIPTTEAEKIRTNKIDFLRDCKVIVVRS